MKIQITVEVELRDWVRAKTLPLKKYIGTMSMDSGIANGVVFTIDQNGLALMVSQKDTHREAVVDLRPLLEEMGVALVKHAEAIHNEEPG